MNVDGTGLRRLTRLHAEPGLKQLDDLVGTRLVSGRAKDPLRAGRVGRAGFVNSEILVMNADGSRQRNLTRNSADGDPVWSPDGRNILFVSKRDGYGDIYVMNADGSGQRNLARLPGRLMRGSPA